MRRPATAARLVLAAVAASVLLPGAAPARAAGTGGIEVTPVPGIVDGRTVTSFRVQAPGEGEREQVRFSLRNLTKEPRTARLYGADAVRQGDGSWSVGGAGSSDLVTLADEQVTLRPEEVQQRTFTLRGDVERTAYAAVVLEVRRGSVVTRAATLVTVRPAPDLPIPLLLGLGATAVALAAGTGVVLVARRRRAAPVPVPPGAEPDLPH